MKKREYAFDLLRIISMFMVIVIHVSNVYSRHFAVIASDDYLASLIYNTICRVSVPIFFMISGALLLDRNFDKQKYRKRITHIITLIIVWDIIYLVWEYFFSGITRDHLYRLLWEPYRKHLWFLYTIVVLYILQPIMKWILAKSPKIVKIILLMIWFSISFCSVINPRLVSRLSIIIYIGYFIIGKYLYDWIKTKSFKKYTIVEVIIMIICFGMSIYLNYKTSISKNAFYNLYFAYKTPFIVFSSLALFTLVITHYQKEKVEKEIEILSDVSLGVYLIHGIFLDIIKRFPILEMKALFSIPLLALIIFIVSVMSVWLLKKIKIMEKIF